MKAVGRRQKIEDARMKRGRCNRDAGNMKTGAGRKEADRGRRMEEGRRI